MYLSNFLITKQFASSSYTIITYLSLFSERKEKQKDKPENMSAGEAGGSETILLGNNNTLRFHFTLLSIVWWQFVGICGWGRMKRVEISAERRSGWDRNEGHPEHSI